MNPHVSFSITLSAATLVCFSFLGFDSVTNLSKETIAPERNIPLAILLILLIAGGFYIIASYISQLVNPSLLFKNSDTAAFELIKIVGGNMLSSFFIATYAIGCFSSATASATTVSRILYVMGRDAVLPKRVFGYVHPKFKTPVFNILIVGVAMFSSLVMSLNTAMSFINFGALVAFTFVNLSVIAHYYYRNRLRSFKQSIQYLLLPIIGACFILWLWMQTGTR